MRKGITSLARKCSCLIAAIVFLTTAQSFAAPTVQEVTGSLQDGGAISIKGSGFGASGPNLVLFDSFDKGTTGLEIPLNNPVIGEWAAASIATPTFDVAPASGHGMRTFTSGKGTNLLKARFPTTSEVLVSYRVRLQNQVFPNTATPNTFPAGSSWKMAWIMNGDDGYRGQDDLCLPTFADGTYFMVTGNGTPLLMRTGNKGTDRWFSFDSWMRITVFLKGGAPDPAVDNGIAWFQAVNGTVQKTYLSTAKPVMGGTFNGNPRGWTQINFPGWLNGAIDQSTRPVYDDIYIATGTNARARVEIGDAATYSSCTNLALATVNSWSDASITATFRLGTFSPGKDAFLYVSDGNGVVNPAGFPVKLAGVTPPGNLRGTVVK